MPKEFGGTGTERTEREEQDAEDGSQSFQEACDEDKEDHLQ